MRFELEEVKAIALGKNWVAAVTSFNFLRIFTEGGLQVFLTSFYARYIENLNVFVAMFDKRFLIYFSKFKLEVY